MKPLALKYRPLDWTALVGNNLTKTILINSIKKNKVRSAYFFSGNRGSGKTSSARIFAKAINCLAPVNGSPCNECESCKAVNNNTAVDIIEIDAASENSVASIRELISSIQYLPSHSNKKVVILDECHLLSLQAGNALLKTLEEPPEHVVWIFCTTDPQKVLETIKSRCMMFQFKRLGKDDIVVRLKEICVSENIEYEIEALEFIGSYVNGAVRDAVMLLDQASMFGKVTYEVVNELAGFITIEELNKLFVDLKDGQKSLVWVTEKLKVNTGAEVINSILNYLNVSIFIKNGVKIDTMITEVQEEVKLIINQYSLETVSEFISEVKKAYLDLKNKLMSDILIVNTLVNKLSLIANGKGVGGGSGSFSFSVSELVNALGGGGIGGSEEDILSEFFTVEIINNLELE